MNFPRIYSFSTIGILKHYVHDYLFHPLRTDFIGPNGVGKSIIADLLQILFIFDKSRIQFGTDGVNPRYLEKIPYKTSIAYCFIVVEVQPGQFLVLGTAIDARKNGKLLPFVITAGSDLEGRLEDLAIPSSDIPIATSFLKGGIIPELEPLVRHLRDSKGLYLTYFRDREQIRHYYQFLFNKHVLSINLSVDRNLEAFAKVIQSFSKAKSLNLAPASASRSLKEFLFEDSDREIVKEYGDQRQSLHTLLREYDRLNRDIEQLKIKQSKLKGIKELDLSRQKASRELKEGELSLAYHELQTVSAQENENKKRLGQKKEHSNINKRKTDKLPRIKELIDLASRKIDKIYDLATQYGELAKRKEGLYYEIAQLKVLPKPILTEAWRTNVQMVDLSIRRADDLKKLFQEADYYLNRYESIEQLMKTREAQQNELMSLHEELKDREGKLLQLISVFEGKDQKGILQWMLQQTEGLSEEKLSAILYFADTPILKKETPSNGSKYLDPATLMKEWEVVSDAANGGFWLKLGALHEFIANNPDASLLVDAPGIGRSIEALLEKKRDELERTQRTRLEVKKALDGKAYDVKLLGRQFDLAIMVLSNIDSLKTAIACIIGLDEKIDQLGSQIKVVIEEIDQIKQQIPRNSWAEEPEVLMRNMTRLRNLTRKRSENYIRYDQNLANEQKQLGLEIAALEREHLSLAEIALKKKQEFETINREYFETYNQNFVEYSEIQESGITRLKKTAETANQDYISLYSTAVESFEETEKQKNLPVGLELINRTYAFRPLEEALLGSKIKTTDDIADALAAANRERLTMADEMKQRIVKVFQTTVHRYRKFKDTVQNMNKFFVGKKISNRFFFKIEFRENKTFKISFVEDLGERIRNAASRGELSFEKPVDEFIQDFFKHAAQLTEQVTIEKLLSPNTYFDLSVSLTDEQDNEISGSTGETYSAIALLGIARLSIAQPEMRRGLRFIILEELGSLDNTNFNTFPAIAKEFDYQIITMAPRAYMSGITNEWYAHNLIKGNVDDKINFHPSASYFHTRENNEDLEVYLKRLNNELAGA